MSDSERQSLLKNEDTSMYTSASGGSTTAVAAAAVSQGGDVGIAAQQQQTEGKSSINPNRILQADLMFFRFVGVGGIIYKAKS